MPRYLLGGAICFQVYRGKIGIFLETSKHLSIFRYDSHKVSPSRGRFGGGLTNMPCYPRGRQGIELVLKPLLNIMVGPACLAAPWFSCPSVILSILRILGFQDSVAPQHGPSGLLLVPVVELTGFHFVCIDIPRRVYSHIWRYSYHRSHFYLHDRAFRSHIILFHTSFCFIC